MSQTAKVLTAMVAYYAGDAPRVHHFLKVYAFAKAIGEQEGLPAETQEVLEIAALTHDIGIKISEEKYGSSAGPYQELEGPDAARALLAPFGLPHIWLERICWLIAHHHTYSAVDGIDCRILMEADFLVNAYEDKLSLESIRKAREALFRTATGIAFLDQMYLSDKHKE